MSEQERTLTLKSLEDTDRLGACLAKHVPASACIVMSGTLGAGKTRLTQAMLTALQIPREEIVSPTFAIVRTYPSVNRTIHHMDAYRIADEDEFLELGVEEMLEAPNTTCIIEWGERVRNVLPEDTLWITIEWQSTSARHVHLSGAGPWLRIVPLVERCFSKS